MPARAGSKSRSQPVRLSMVSVSTDDRDSAAPEPRVRGCVVVTKTSGCLVNAFSSEHRDAPRVRTRPLCAMLCAMHSLAGGVAAPRSVFRLDGLAVGTQESREGTIVAVLADPEADDDALATVTRIVARAFAAAARLAVAGVVDADLLAAETRGLDETHTDATLELFAGFHAGYLATNVLGRPASLAERWLGAIAAVPGVCAAHAFLGLAREERPGLPTDREDDESRYESEPPPLPTVSMLARDRSRGKDEEPTRSGTNEPKRFAADPLTPARFCAGSPEWRALRRRAAAMLEAAKSRGDGTSRSVLTDTVDVTFPYPTDDDAHECRSEGETLRSETLRVTLRAFAAAEHALSEEASETPATYRDAACVAAVSVFADAKIPSSSPVTETSPHCDARIDGLEDAFARAEEVVLADLAFPAAETHAPRVARADWRPYGSPLDAAFDAAFDAPGSPTSPLERASDASPEGSAEESEALFRAAPPKHARSRRGTRVYPYEPSAREGRGGGAKA